MASSGRAFEESKLRTRPIISVPANRPGAPHHPFMQIAHAPSARRAPGQVSARPQPSVNARSRRQFIGERNLDARSVASMGARCVRAWGSNRDLKAYRRGARQLLKAQRSANATEASDFGTFQRERAGLRAVTRNSKSTY